MGCTWHPERDAIGICVVCRRAVCGDCATDVDGIQRCEGCLADVAEARREPEASPRARGWTARRAAATVAGWAWLTALIWAAFEAMRSAG